MRVERVDGSIETQQKMPRQESGVTAVALRALRWIGEDSMRVIPALVLIFYGSLLTYEIVFAPSTPLSERTEAAAARYFPYDDCDWPDLVHC